MKLKDTLLIKHGNKVVVEMLYIASTQTQHLFSKPENIVGITEKAVLWSGEVGTTSFIPIKKKHNFIQLDKGSWELDIEPIESDDL